MVESPSQGSLLFDRPAVKQFMVEFTVPSILLFFSLSLKHCLLFHVERLDFVHGILMHIVLLRRCAESATFRFRRAAVSGNGPTFAR